MLLNSMLITQRDRIVTSYLCNLACNFICDKKSNCYDAIKKIRRKMQLLLKKYRKQIGISVNGNPDFFEIAYPKSMFIYWTIKAQINKLKR